MTSLLLIYLVLICLLHLTELEWSGFAYLVTLSPQGHSQGLAQRGYSLNTVRGTYSHSSLPLGGGIHRGHSTHCWSWNCLLQTPIPGTQGEQASEEGAGLGTSQQLFTIPSRKGYNLGDVTCMNVLHTFSLLTLSYFFDTGMRHEPCSAP